MTSVGEILRTERETQGRGMAEIAEELCITQRYLRAIEEDDVKSLPGSFFYKSFVKQYAAVLGIDEQRLRPAIEILTSTFEPEPLPGADPRYSESAIPSPARAPDPFVEDANRHYLSDRRIGLPLAGLVAVLLVCSGFYAWWNKAPQSVSGGRSVKMADPAPAKTPTVDVSTTTEPDGRVVLSLSATEETWLSITSDGKEVFSGILQPSQTKTLTGLDVAKMRVGNAGGLEVRWNGKQIGPIGRRGEVRVVLFTPENFQILTPSQTL
jgi:cytoskeletal protein RodZ